MESLNLEAGKLGKLLLFKLVARGIGYTADVQVVLNFTLPLTGPTVGAPGKAKFQARSLKRVLRTQLAQLVVVTGKWQGSGKD